MKIILVCEDCGRELDYDPTIDPTQEIRIKISKCSHCEKKEETEVINDLKARLKKINELAIEEKGKGDKEDESQI